MDGRRVLFLAVFCIVAMLTKTDPDSAHVMSRLGTVESIVDRGTYALDDSIFIGTVDKIQRDGHFYSHQPPLLATIEAPIYWLLHLPGTRFNNRGRFVMTYAFSLLTNGLALAATVLVFARLLSVAGVPHGDWLAAMLVFGTWLLPYGLVPNNHGVSGLLVAVLIVLMLDLSRTGATSVRLAALGATVGLLGAIEWLPLVSFVPVIVIYLLARRDLSAPQWVAFSVALAAPVIAHVAINIPITGDVLPAGFHTELFHYEGSVFDDSSLTGTLKYHNIGDAAGYAWSSLFAGKGFFVFSPLCLLGIVAGLFEWRWWWEEARGAYAVLVASAAISIAVALLTTNNYGGEAVGFRHAVYVIPIFLVLLMPWLRDQPRRRIVMAVAIASTASMLVYAVRQPWFVLTIHSAHVGTWDQYVPLLAKLVHGTLFTP